MVGKKVFKIGLFKRLRKDSWKWRFYWSSLKWKRVHLPLTFMDDVVFKLVSAFEAVVLVVTLCFFYLFFGCNF